MIAWLVTDLPEPDSPTMASVLFFATSKRHAVDGADDAVLGRELDAEVLDLEEWVGHASLTRGSMTA